jgi:ABC-type siderophore export system fused ATPase/permease subunit
MLYLVHLIAVDVCDPALQRPHHHRARARHSHRFEVPVGVSSTVRYVTVQCSTVQCVIHAHFICMSYVSYLLYVSCMCVYVCVCLHIFGSIRITTFMTTECNLTA